MEILVIGKPAINAYVPLQEFPSEGDVFVIKAKNESLGGVGATSACLLAKWGMSTHFNGLIGMDKNADLVKSTLKEYKLEDRYVETNYQYQTAVNYIIVNNSNGISTKVICSDPEIGLTKYKYDFQPDYAILDGDEYLGALALLNNDAKCKTIFYARIGTKENIALSKRTNYVVATERFALELTKMQIDGSNQSYVDLYQKIVDVSGNSSYIVILNNHKILYSDEGQVKMLPEMKLNSVDNSSFDSVFTGTICYALANGMNINDAVKLANTSAAMSMNRLGEIPAIPELNDVLNNSGLRGRLSVAQQQEQVGEPINGSIGSVANTPVVEQVPTQEVQQSPVIENQVINESPVTEVAPVEEISQVNIPAQDAPMNDFFGGSVEQPEQIPTQEVEQSPVNNDFFGGTMQQEQPVQQQVVNPFFGGNNPQ